MASEAATATRERARTAVAVLAITGFVLVAVVLPVVGADAPGGSLLDREGAGEAGTGDGSGALGDVLGGRNASGGGGEGSLVEGLVGSLSGGDPGSAGQGSGGGAGERLGDGGGFGALDPGERTGVGSQGAPLSDSLRNQSAEPHFLVQSSAATYWRTGAYARYTGDGWEGRGEATSGNWPREPTTAADDRETITQRYRLLQPAGSLPAAWQPTDVGVDDATDVRVTDQGGLRYAGGLSTNATYTVTSAAPPRDPGRLRAAGTDYPNEIESRYVDGAGDGSDRLESFTDDLTADADTPYDQAVAIEGWLEANKRYSLNASHEGGDVAEQFVFEMERGYCEYFATAMAVMLRSQDIPARYVVGYSTGEPRSNDTYLVRAMNAHAWVEMYVPGTGWVRFDPTPGRERLASEFRAYQRAAENGDAEGAARRFLESASREDGGNPFDPDGQESASGGESGPDPGDGSGEGDDGTDGSGEGDGAENASEDAETYNHTESGSPGETFDPASEASVQVSLSSDPVPGQRVGVRVERDGDPVPGVAVAFDGRRIGVTNESGQVSGEVPFSAQLDVTVSVPDDEGGPAGSAALALPTTLAGSSPAAPLQNETNTTRTFDVPTAIAVGVEGDPAPGASVTVNATIAGSPVSQAAVTVNGTDVGRTGSDGRLDVTLPVRERASIRVERGEAAGNRTLRLADLNVTVSGFALPGLSVTATVTDGGEPVPGATVSAGGETVETGSDGTATVSLPLSPGATVTAETPAGLTESQPVQMRYLTAGFLAVLAILAVAGAVMLRSRAVAAGRSLREQVRVALHWLSGAFVAGLVALAVRGEALLAALPAHLRRLRSALAEAIQAFVAAVRAREFDLGRLPAPRAILTHLFAALARLVGRVGASLSGRDSNPEPDPPAATAAATDDPTPDARERVRRAWREFRAQVPVADHRTKTPGELARSGVDAGFPRSAVRTLRDAIRDVEYGRRDPAGYVDAVDEAQRELSKAGGDGAESAAATDGGEASDGSAESPDGSENA
ncbi:transglutaminase domain-containing protein [Halorientalis halophila]|uniref:transglutaminase domain-containing protein n=1 Tax=Halorientalis halophila TaxID=3108499 RepID=UPI0030096D49